jgi:two-component system cell cycle sensor histidine kinase/response regulator CckA
MTASPDLSTLCFAPEDGEQDFLLHPLASLLYDPATGRILAANVAAETMYGWTRAEFASMTLEDVRPPEERANLRRHLAERARIAGSRQFRGVHWRRNGEPLEVEVVSQAMRLEGRPVRRAVITDVSPRSRAEALFRGVAEQSLTGIYVLQDQRFLYINPRLAEMFGYSVEEIMAEADPWRLLTDDARALATSKSTARLAGERESVRYTLLAKRRDDMRIIVEIFGSSILLRGRPALLGTVLDVTERVDGEAALLESERRFRAAFDQTITGMAITAPDGRWLQVNRALCDMLGYSADELMARTYQEVTHAADVEQNVALTSALLRGDIPSYRLEKRFIRKDGHLVWVELSAALVRDADGHPLYLVAQATDITAQKRAEAALGESEAQLRQAQKMEAVGRLAGGVAHDFNNLLTVIGSNAEIGAELARSGEATPEEFAEIQAAVERAAALTRQLLTFSRRQVLSPNCLSLNDVVSVAERMLRRVIGEDVVLETQFDARAGEVFADRGQLEQVLMNLVVNARDAMPDGGRVVIATHHIREGHASLSVTDTGSGMDAETQARAFEPFFTTKALGLGTGLGLSTVYGIAQQADGQVSIRSVPAEGTTITLTLPTIRSRGVVASGAPPDCAAAAASEQRGLILLVEDEAAVRAVAKRILTRVGFDVLEARDGTDALVLWAQHRERIRLVLTDAVMPVMGGRELVERLKADGLTAPVLFMSGYADGNRGGDVPGGSALIGKPFSADALIERVAGMLAAHAAEGLDPLRR